MPSNWLAVEAPIRLIVGFDVPRLLLKILRNEVNVVHLHHIATAHSFDDDSALVSAELSAKSIYCVVPLNVRAAI
jgi:hypothetical protein